MSCFVSTSPADLIKLATLISSMNEAKMILGKTLQEKVEHILAFP